MMLVFILLWINECIKNHIKYATLTVVKQIVLLKKTSLHIFMKIYLYNNIFSTLIYILIDMLYFIIVVHLLNIIN